MRTRMSAKRRNQDGTTQPTLSLTAKLPDFQTVPPPYTHRVFGDGTPAVLITRKGNQEYQGR